MSEPYVGEIRMVGFSFAPAGWAFCNGQLMSIADNQALFAVIGTTYGGDGQTTFALPNLQGRIPFHQGNSYILGQIAGSESVTLVTGQLPVHTHVLNANSGAGSQPAPTGGYWAQSTLGEYSSEAAAHTMASNAVGPTGGSQPHDNIPPFLVINFVISLFGIFPSQS